MPQVTIYATNEMYNNNISGNYEFEDNLIASATSSSNSVENDALLKFTTVGAGVPANAKITSAVFNIYESFFYDPNEVGNLIVYGDYNNVWGVLGPEDPPIAAINFGTTQEGLLGKGVGWQARILTPTLVPKSAIFNIGITMDCSDLGPAEAHFDSLRNVSNRKANIVIDYIVPGAPSMAMMGVGC